MKNTRPRINDPYPPSWLDQLINSIERLPIPWPTLYLILASVFVAAEILILTLIDKQPLASIVIRPPMILYACFGPYVLGFAHYIDRRAKKAFSRVAPFLKRTKADRQRLEYELTTIPRRAAAFAGLFGFCLFILVHFVSSAGDIFLAETTPTTSLLRHTEGVVWWIVSLMNAFHSFHQMRTIDTIYSKHVTVSLLNLEPLYSLSAIGFHTAMAFILPLIGIMLLYPDILSDFIGLLITVGLSILSVAIIVLPVVRIHTLLEDQKINWLTKNANSIEKTQTSWHKGISDSNDKAIDKFQKVLPVLYQERDRVLSLPTWPWRPAAFRNNLAALSLPTVIWIVQRFLEDAIP